MAKISGSNIKYEDKSAVSAESSHVHDNVDVRGVGHTVKIDKSNPTLLPVEEGWFDELIRFFGRWLLGKKRNIGIPVIILPSFASLYIVVDWGWVGHVEIFGNTVALWIRVASVFWLLVVLGLFIMLRRDKCPKCNRLIAVRPIKKEELGKTKYQGRLVHTIRATYRCDYCNHTFSTEFPEEE